MFVTRTGEITVLVKSYSLLAKALRTLPEKMAWTQRSGNPPPSALSRPHHERGFRRRFDVRRSVIRTIRRKLEDDRFVEVETPILQTKPSGALAKPFITHHNALTSISIFASLPKPTSNALSSLDTNGCSSCPLFPQ